VMDGRQLADFSLVDQPTIGLRLGGARLPKAEASPLLWAPLPGDPVPGSGRQEEVRHMVLSGLHALGWGLQRLGFVLAVTFLAAILAIAIIVTVLVGIQAATEFGQ
jgi:hypothetical protein